MGCSKIQQTVVSWRSGGTFDNEIEIRCMGIIGENKFVWPETDDVCWYENSDIIFSIEPTNPVCQRGFGLCGEDLEKVKELIQSFFVFFVDICYM